MYGYGLSLHLVATTVPLERKAVKIARIKHFTSSLPRVDHIAFITPDLSCIRQTLQKHKVFYKEDAPTGTGIEQIFFFDPDGNVIEVSNCQPSVGEIACSSFPASSVCSPLANSRYSSAGLLVDDEISDSTTSTLVAPSTASVHFPAPATSRGSSPCAIENCPSSSPTDVRSLSGGSFDEGNYPVSMSSFEDRNDSDVSNLSDLVAAGIPLDDLKLQGLLPRPP